MYEVNQNAWFVARENYKDRTIEYLDNDRDLFYASGVLGFTTKIEAHDRADRYKGDKRGVFIMGPSYGRYRLTDARRTQRIPRNTTLNRFEIFDRLYTRETPSPEVIEEFRVMLRDFALTYGLLCFSNVAKCKTFVSLCKKYNALSETDMVKVLYEVQE